MKRRFFCFLLMLCMTLPCIALAGDSCCCCCRDDNVCAQNAGGESPAAAPRYDYTQEITIRDYRIFVPSTFRCGSQDDENANLHSTSSNASISMGISTERPEFLSLWDMELNETIELDEIPAYLEAAAKESVTDYIMDYDYDIVQADECPASIIYSSSATTEIYYAYIMIYNRKEPMTMLLLDNDPDALYELARGLLEHIVAPLFPLDALKAEAAAE